MVKELSPSNIYTNDGRLQRCPSSRSTRTHRGNSSSPNMIEALVAIALAGNILQFVQASGKALIALRTIWETSATDENVEIEVIAQDVTDLSQRLANNSASNAIQSTDEKELQQLAQRCEPVARELIAMLQDLVVRSQGTKRRIEVMQKTLKLIVQRSSIERLLKRVQDLRDQLSTRMLFILR